MFIPKSFDYMYYLLVTFKMILRHAFERGLARFLLIHSKFVIPIHPNLAQKALKQKKKSLLLSRGHNNHEQEKMY